MEVPKDKVRSIMTKHGIDKAVINKIVDNKEGVIKVDDVNKRLYTHALLNDKPTLAGLLTSERNPEAWCTAMDDVWCPLYQIMDGRYRNTRRT